MKRPVLVTIIGVFAILTGLAQAGFGAAHRWLVDPPREGAIARLAQSRAHVQRRQQLGRPGPRPRHPAEPGRVHLVLRRPG